MIEVEPSTWSLPALYSTTQNLLGLSGDIRQRCRVAEAFGRSLFRHEDVMRGLNDPATFKVPA